MKYGFVIPVYRHGATLEGVVKNLVSHGLPIIVVDDGNDEINKQYIKSVGEKYSLVTVVTLKKNSGKGSAMNAGIEEAYKMGLTHILQIDSDGQHESSRVSSY